MDKALDDKVQKAVQDRVEGGKLGGAHEKSNDEDEYFERWHDAHFRLLSRASQIPIFTVDNSIHMTGEEYHGKTSSESGVIINGEWVTNVPRTGIQYFYYDFAGGYIGT